MKKIKSLFSAALLSCCALLFSASSNAVVITTNVNLGGIDFATIETNLDDSLVGSGLGLVSTFDAVGFDLVDLYVPIADGFDPFTWWFEAIIDVDNIMAGVEFVTFDVEDSDGWLYYLYADSAFVDSSYGSIYDVSSGYLFEAFGSDVQLTSTIDVPEPALFGLFAIAFAGMVLRRRV
ncbi:PEP-CTERM sorting domain-containing protein [Alteromonas sp. C1M14]|uniref:PEP-CTERM sorting domain-containing protein n=1 Tax=Alteromonas sp. C1M14 TaxID=2841567 RepID=UPI001C09165E|nr:PEP-CTERM sorting domain-containing protein [Alteromonas sp. C1M14]MBU2978980.1 PEP-CTERM sorting domain-containing protein [Alteromonas sp. C1M14]